MQTLSSYWINALKESLESVKGKCEWGAFILGTAYFFIPHVLLGIELEDILWEKLLAYLAVLVLVVDVFIVSPFRRFNERDRMVAKLQAELDQRPLIGIALRNEIDSWIKTSNLLFAELHTEQGASAIPKAKEWMEALRKFSGKHLSVSDYDALNSLKGADDFARVVIEKMAESQPAWALNGAREAISHRYTHLLRLRQNIK